MSSITYRWVRRAVRSAAAFLFLVAVVAESSPSFAIPAFARKYHTSCQTCHIAFPALNPFGEAYRLNGYRFPAGSDSSVSKDDAVALGSDGYKKLWPRAVWPGELAGTLPVSMTAESELSNDRATKSTSFNGAGAAAEIQAGGTFGDHASFFGNLVFERPDGGATETTLERMSILFRPWSSPAFQFKVGAFDPGLLLISTHRSVVTTEYLSLTQTVGDNGWAAEPTQNGAEFFGVAAHRLLYNAGYVEGAGNAASNSKDVYGRVAYKFGGLTLDGTTKGTAAAGLPANPKPWSEKSFTVSAFVYKGSPLLSQTTTTLVNDPNTNIVSQVDTTIEQDDRFTMYGGEVKVNFLNLIFYAGASARTDRHPFLADFSPAATDVSSKNWWGEAQWVALPWLIPAARWESFDVAGAKTERYTATVNMLVRANVKTFVAADWLKEPTLKYRTEEIVAGLVFGL
ncbi:MAG: hypothetical protein HY049_14460 [Acidobacteria bacterium]|nr:hypothetical protein [Acidobacteriota bacterium]